MRPLVLLFLFSLSTLFSYATRAEADSAYMRHDYGLAASLYERAIATDTADANTFYNQGNAYYQLKQYGKAVLAYERAILHDPDFQEAHANLALTRTKLKDHFDAPAQNIFAMLTSNILQNTGIDTWAFLSIVAFTLSLIATGVYLLTSPKLVRKIAFFVALILIAITLACNVFGFATRQLMRRTRFVVLTETPLYSSPSAKSQKIRLLHEGTTVQILSKSPHWIQVVLPDEKEGWISVESGERIHIIRY
ncbi:MAG: tetratricopeptide repeat protein [Bacteroidales bacterium]|nr:tetratricopeptide repeat protein [Bacteroidales bacterium]